MTSIVYYSGCFSVWESFGTSKWFLSIMEENGLQWRMSSTCCRSAGIIVNINLLISLHLHLQGVWVFLTFVCKRNVLQVILRKRDRLYSAVLQRSRTKSSKISNIEKYFLQIKNISNVKYFRRDNSSARECEEDVEQRQKESSLPADWGGLKQTQTNKLDFTLSNVLVKSHFRISGGDRLVLGATSTFCQID